ncbi:MAG: tetratricopeptide repeat protein [Chthonomonas sp.]|nr:tetratricopeptide repeat protein [Chthonomonas sp.]
MAVSPNPTGLLTFLMTDVEGSTRLWEDAAKEMGESMRLHDALSQEIVEAHEGRVIKERGEGDALFCVFKSATQAVKASIALQLALASTDWPTPRPIRVRMALHVGEAEERGGDYYGPVINRCARLRGICYGQQIIVSEAVSQTARGTNLLDLGSHRLKDLSTPEHVFQVLADGLLADFPPLLSLGNSPNNLPEHASSFIGREKESKELAEQMATHRLVTLVGPGGTGKTRLAQHIAESSIESFPDGVWLIELDRLSTSDEILTEVAHVLRAPDVPGASDAERITQFLSTRKVLLLLDNCEHVRSDVAQLAAQWLRSAENLQIMATSREPLAIAGEGLYRVPSLGIPSADNESPLSLMGYESVQLFIERGKSVRADLQLTEANCAAVSRIVRQLDGIPFALELAAARARAMSVEQIAERIDDRFRILGKGDTSRPNRQHTLRALIDWSYESLSEDERTLLNRLSAFSGGWTLEAAEKVVGFDPLDEFDVLDLLVSLVDKSLVVYDTDHQRYRLLETIRQYATERLDEAEETALAQSKHSEYFLHEAERIAKGLSGRDPNVWMDRVDPDLDNFRQAIRNSKTKEPNTASRIVVGLYRYFDAQTIFSEPRELLEELIKSPLSDEVRGPALHSLGIFCRRQGDFHAAKTYLTEAITLQEASGDPTSLASPSIGLATIELFLGNPTEAITIAERALVWCESLADFRNIATLRLILGNARSLLGENVTASEQFELAMVVARENKIPDLQVYAQVNLGLNLSKQGEFDRASNELRQVLELAQAMGVRAVVLDCLRFLAQAETGLNHWPIAATLYGFEESMRAKAGVKLSESDQWERDADIATLTSALGEAEFEKTTKHHRESSIDDVLAWLQSGAP